jgi:hypothetical protein
MSLVKIYYSRPNGCSYDAIVKESQICDIKNYSDINIIKIKQINDMSVKRDYILK